MKSLFKNLHYSFIFILFTSAPGFSQSMLQPVSKQIGKLSFSVDPRMELLCAAQIQADYPVISQKPKKIYDEFKTYFAPYKEHAAVKNSFELFKNNGFSYDAPITYMLYLSQPLELKQQIPFSEYLIKRAGSNDNLVKYTTNLQNFAVQSNFETYWNQHLPLYKSIIEQTVGQLKDRPLIEQLESYYGMEQNSYNIILSPMFAGGKGAKLQASNGKYDLYACIQATKIKDSIPYLPLFDIYYFAWHEFGHSFVNPLTEKYLDLVNKSGYLFNPIVEGMKQQAYSNWETCVNEHIIRAVVIRMQELYNHWDANASFMAIAMEHRNQFIYIDRVIEKLKEYEIKHNETKITFEQYYPELIKAFNISKTELDSILTNFKFEGPVNNVSVGKTILIYPTFQSDTFPLNKIKNYVEEIHQRFYKNLPIISDEEALKTDLSSYNIIVYGTMGSNLWLKKYAEEFPFQMKSDKVILDKEYPGTTLKWITCLPNPQNKRNGLLIYTAQQSKDIIDINRVPHGSKDFYLVDSNGNKSISEGYYKKGNSKWKFN